MTGYATIDVKGVTARTLQYREQAGYNVREHDIILSGQSRWVSLAPYAAREARRLIAFQA